MRKRVVVIMFVVMSLSVTGLAVLNRRGKTMETSAARVFRDRFLDPAMGPDSTCVDPEMTKNGWIKIKAKTTRPCELAGAKNPLLAVFLDPRVGDNLMYKLVPEGRYKLLDNVLDLGAAPMYSPAYTLCAGGEGRTLLLQTQKGYGHLPPILMEFGPGEIDGGGMFSHETGHAVAEALGLRAISDDMADAFENWYFETRRNGLQRRRYHNYPANPGVNK